MSPPAPKPSAPPAANANLPASGGAELPPETSPTRGASVRSSLGAFVASLAGVGDVAPDDPHRGAKWAGGLVGLAITAFFVTNAIRGHKQTRREGYKAGRAAEQARVARAGVAPRPRKR